MTKSLSSLWRLTRFYEYVAFVVITTLLGAAAGGGSLGWPLVVALAANWLAVGFAFMINDVEDAPDDALTPAKARRNPVSAGELSPRLARALSFSAAALAAGLYAWLGLGPFVIGVICLVLAWLYSWRRVRLKAIPVADLISHIFMLAGLQLLAAYATFRDAPDWNLVFPLAFVMAISLYGQLFNELRDFEGDLKAGVTHTASFLGARRAYVLMMIWLAIGVVSAGVFIFVFRLIPTWVLLTTAGLAALFSVWPIFEVRRAKSVVDGQGSFHKPLEAAAALALSAWFVSPAAMASLEALLLLAAGR